MTIATSVPPGRERILGIAAGRFLSDGYVETSLRHIAADAGMKAGSLYYHFESKDRLLIAVLERGMEHMVDAFLAVESRYHSIESDMDVLGQHVQAHLQALHGNRSFTAGHVTLFRTAPAEVRQAVVPLRDGYEAMWGRLLARLLPDSSKQERAMLRLTLFGAMNASIDWLDAERGNVSEFAKLVTEQFWLGVSNRAATSRGAMQ